jgi:hypothetical protein
LLNISSKNLFSHHQFVHNRTLKVQEGVKYCDFIFHHLPQSKWKNQQILISFLLCRLYCLIVAINELFHHLFRTIAIHPSIEYNFISLHRFIIWNKGNLWLFKYHMNGGSGEKDESRWNKMHTKMTLYDTQAKLNMIQYLRLLLSIREIGRDV